MLVCVIRQYPTIRLWTGVTDDVKALTKLKDEDEDEDEKEVCRRTNSCDTNSANVVVNCTSLMIFLQSLGIIDILDISFVFAL